MVKVVTDSTADLPPELAESLSITVVPLSVHFGEAMYRDGVDLSSEEFFAKLSASPVLPTTSVPPVGAFLEVYRRLAEETPEVLSVHVSTKLSGTYNSAVAARDALDRPCRIEIMDSRSVSMGLGLVVLAAARAAQAGGDFEAVMATAQQAIASTHLLLVVDTLEYLQRGGRIGRAAAFLGSLLNIKPILTVEDGEVHPVERVRSRARALERLVEWARGFAKVEELAVAHSASPDEAQRVVTQLRALYPGVPLCTSQIGPVVGTHAGPGVVGVAVREGV